MKKRTKVLIGVLTICVLILIVLDLRSTLGWDKKHLEKVPTFTVGPYTLVEGRTDYLNNARGQLEGAVKSNDDQSLIKAVANYFVADYFTLKNKQTFNDVGGLGLVLPVVKSQFKTNAIDSFYVDLSSLIDAYKAENLPEITNVKIDNVEKLNSVPDLSKYPDSKDKNMPTKVEQAYDARTSFGYRDNNVLDTSNLINQAVVRLVKVNNVWYVLELLQ